MVHIRINNRKNKTLPSKHDLHYAVDMMSFFGVVKIENLPITTNVNDVNNDSLYHK